MKRQTITQYIGAKQLPAFDASTSGTGMHTASASRSSGSHRDTDMYV